MKADGSELEGSNGKGVGRLERGRIIGRKIIE